MAATHVGPDSSAQLSIAGVDTAPRTIQVGRQPTSLAIDVSRQRLDVAAKQGVAGLTRAAALDLIGHGIRVNAVCPGAIDTAILFLCSPAASYADGHLLVLDGGISLA